MRRYFNDLSLTRKLMLATMVIVLAATLTMLLFLERQAAGARAAQWDQFALGQSRLVAEYVVSPLVFEDDSGAKELLAKLARDREVAYVRIIDRAGKVFAEVGTPMAVPDAVSASEGVTRQGDITHAAVPIVHQGRAIGRLVAGYRAEAVDAAVTRDRRMLLAVLAAVVAASFLLARFLQRLITTPLLDLERHAQQVAESQDFSRRLEPRGQDEIGSLYTTFNHLVERIRAREEDILALNRSLESKVAERTRDLEAARDRADRASLSKSEFLANMSHEIRTPINAISGFTALALRTPLTGKQAGYLERIQAASQGLLHIVNDLLDFSKIEAGHLDMEKIPFALAEVIDTVVAYVGTLAERKGLELLVEVDPAVPAHLVGDPLRVGQVLVNLCGNAVKFTEKGEVALSVKVEPWDAGAGDSRARLLFSVRDTGIGLSPQESERLFQPFTQADASTTRRFGGTGLGLVICRRLVELMGGRIWLESKVGEGSTFHCVMELGIGAPDPAAVPAAGAQLAGHPALIVDDNANARQILEAQLTSFGMSARAVDSGEAALAELRRASAAGKPYPLVLMDWKMPGMDGIAATHAIRSDAAIARTPVIIMVTAFGREQSIAAPENAALLDGVLLKPVTPTLLAETLARALAGQGERRATDERVPAAPRERRLPGIAVLLVEDNPINQQVAQELLEHEGAAVSIAGDGAAALALLEESADGAFDLALMDLQMPVMDGYEAARRIRAHPRWATLPLVAMTAHAMREERDRCLAVGMNDHVSKPVDPELLVKKVLQAVGPAVAAARAQGYVAPAAADTADTARGTATLPATLPGIDLAAGMVRAMQDAAFYRELLVQFHQHYAGAARELDAMLAGGRREDASFLAHAVKGAAANLGAGDLSRAAAAVEDWLRHRRDAPPPDCTGAFARALDEVISGIAPLEAAPAATAGDDIALDDDGRALLAALREQLAANDTRAEASLAALAARYPAPPAWLTEAGAHVRELDYAAALARLPS